MTVDVAPTLRSQRVPRVHPVGLVEPVENLPGKQQHVQTTRSGTVMSASRPQIRPLSDSL